MKQLQVTLLAVCLAGSMNAKAQALTFAYTPQTAWSSTWVGQAPYQRDISWNFSVNPVGGPSVSGTPGAAYAGTLDSVLMGSDYVTFSGSFQYFSAAQSPDGIAGIGIDNTRGGGTLTGRANFYLGTTIGGAQNNTWIELTQQTGGGPTASSEGVLLAPEYSVSGGIVVENTGQLEPGPHGLFLDMQLDIGNTVTPIPLTEDVIVDFEAYPGSYDMIHSLHIATQSVPEPGTFSLLALGSLALLRRKRGNV